jgi:hypothetical protein
MEGLTMWQRRPIDPAWQRLRNLAELDARPTDPWYRLPPMLVLDRPGVGAPQQAVGGDTGANLQSLDGLGASGPRPQAGDAASFADLHRQMTAHRHELHAGIAAGRPSGAAAVRQFEARWRPAIARRQKGK